MNLDEIQLIFFQECEEALLTIESCFGLCTSGTNDAETINTIFRGVHSIKGGAGAFGHEALQGFAHEYETLLDKVRTGELPLGSALLDTLLAAFDTLSDHIAAAKGEAPLPQDDAMLKRLVDAAHGQAEVVSLEPAQPAEAAAPAAAAADDADFDDIFAMLDDCAAPPADSVPGWQVRFHPGAREFDNGSEPMLLLRELVRMGATTVTADLTELPMLAMLDAEKPYIGWLMAMPGDVAEDEIRAVFDFVDDGSRVEIVRAVAGVEHDDDGFTHDEPAAPVAAPIEPAPAPVIAVATPVAAPAIDVAAAPAAAEVPTTVVPVQANADAAAHRVANAAGQTIRVDLDKLDRLVNLVGELVITQAMLAQRLSVHGIGNVTELTDLDNLTRELQDSAMSIRAQPMKTVFSRVPRIIRELEGETGKRVRLELYGEMTEVDKTVVERIGEPLTHLIRNAVDHGIETPEQRLAAGKQAEGVVRLSAEHRSGRIVISITDDGRGIDRDRVRAKAIERGIVQPDTQMTNEEIDNLIFAPGFSTAEVISNVSGRGVGMDVVRRNVQTLGGRIGITSRAGEGSTFSLSLPLTLAVLDGMIVRIGAETFVIPLSHVVESLRPQPADVRRLGTAALLDVRGSYVPIQDVGNQLGIGGGVAEPSEAVLIVVESDVGQAILMVDTIVDQRQVVVKSLEANYRVVDGLAGATILGDGRVALILDVDALVSRWRQEARMSRQAIGLAA